MSCDLTGILQILMKCEMKVDLNLDLKHLRLLLVFFFLHQMFDLCPIKVKVLNWSVYSVLLNLICSSPIG